MEASRLCKTLSLLFVLATIGCSADSPDSGGPLSPPRPAVLLVTLDTTRADRLGFESDEVATPTLTGLAARGRVFSQAYTTAPVTLPAHASMLTGLYPVDHGVRENGRTVAERQPLLAERLRAEGYATAAFVSGYPLARRFGLARGFDVYDDDFGGSAVERRAGETTDRALAYLQGSLQKSLFLWVHYYDPHEPYEPPEPIRSRYRTDPYLGEIAYMDRELGRLLAGFEGWIGQRPWRLIVVGDHGEGLGDHGETLHGNLLYQGVMRVPLIIAGSELSAGRADHPVSVRQVFDTISGWAGVEVGDSLLDDGVEMVLAEAMKPFLQYGWQPQAMAVSHHLKVIRAGEFEVYDVRSDPAESRNLVGEVEPDPPLMKALRTYWERSTSEEVAAGDSLEPEARERLASLGYVGSEGSARLRQDAPNPKDMTHLFHDLDIGSALFIRRDYAAAIPVFERVLNADPHNLMVCLRLAVAHSALGSDRRAIEYFDRAQAIEPDSVDLRHYLAMHHFRRGDWDRAEPLLEEVVTRMPQRLPALEALTRIRERQGRLAAAGDLLARVAALKPEPLDELVRLGELRMALGDTPAAIHAFERARDLAGSEFDRHLELGVCYLADRQLALAAAALDRVSPSHPGYPMALFKRAQVSVLLGEPDRQERIRLAFERADATTRPLIEGEALFEGYALR